MNRLALAQVGQGLQIAIGDFRSPSCGINSVSLEEGETKVCGKQSVPLSPPPTFAEEKTDCCSSEFGVNGAEGASECFAVPTELLCVELPDDFLGSEVSARSLVPGLPEFNHAEEIAFNMSAGNQTYKVGVGEPAVNKQVIKVDTLPDSLFDHFDSLVGLLHQIFVYTLLNSLSFMVLTEARFPFGLRESLSLVRVLALLTMDGEVEHQLTEAVGEQQRETLVTEDALVGHMGIDTANKLGLLPCLGSVCIIDNKTRGLVTCRLGLAADFLDQLPVHGIEQPAPFYITFIHKTIEYVLFTDKQLA